MRIRKRRVDGVVQSYHVLGKGHSAEVVDIHRGRVLKRFTGNASNLDRNREYHNYVKLGLHRFSVIVPMKWTDKGLMMPRLRVITRSANRHEWKSNDGHIVLAESRDITDTQMLQLLRGLRELSKAGIAADDVLHAGIGKSGKAYFFDVGGFHKEKHVWEAEHENQHYWEMFCEAIGRKEWANKLFRKQDNTILQEHRIETGMKNIFEVKR